MFKAYDYDKKTKTIEVELPDYKKPQFPKTWKKSGNHYITPEGFFVYFWNSGLAENFLVEKFISRYNSVSKTVPAGLYAREDVIKFVESCK